MATSMGPGAEFDLVRSFLAGAPETLPGVRVGPGDDCAVLDGGVCLTTDASVEEVHFRRSWMLPEEIGWRAVAVAMSDLAAMACTPVGVLVSLSANLREPGLAEELMTGARAAVEEMGGALLGGDVAGSLRRMVIDVCAVGRADRPVLRSGALPGDEVWVTGLLGGAAAAVQALLAGWTPSAAAREAYVRPRPRISEALWLAGKVMPHAMIDLSDGLAGDAAHLAAASGAAVVLEVESLPLHDVLEQSEVAEAFQLAVRGGEDYELCFAAAPHSVEPHAEAFAESFGIPLTRVGAVVEGEGVWWGNHEERVRDEGGAFQHLRSVG